MTWFRLCPVFGRGASQTTAAFDTFRNDNSNCITCCTVCFCVWRQHVRLCKWKMYSILFHYHCWMLFMTVSSFAQKRVIVKIVQNQKRRRNALSARRLTSRFASTDSECMNDLYTLTPLYSCTARPPDDDFTQLYIILTSKSASYLEFSQSVLSKSSKTFSRRA